MDVNMDALAVEDSRGVAPTIIGTPQPDGRGAQRLALLNALLKLSLEDAPIERQLLATLDLLLALPWLPLQPQAAVFLSSNNTDVMEMAASWGLSETARAACARASLSCEATDVRGATHGDDAASGCNLQHDALPVRGRYCLPVRHGALLGIVMLYAREDWYPDPDDAEFLSVVATALLGIVVRSRQTEHARRLISENRQLNQRLIALQEEEYRHLARELHDEIGQSIAAIKTETALLAQAYAGENAQRGVQIIGVAVDRIYEAMHEKVRRLRPGVLDDLGLKAAIEAHVGDWQRQRPAVSCRLDIHGRFDDLDEPTKITVYRFVQECLTNIVRHAAATEVRIMLVREVVPASEPLRGRVVLCVSDDGRGANVARLRERSERFGLLAMRERVEGLGGTLTIESVPGRGFKLTASMPVAERRKGNAHTSYPCR